MKTQRGGQFLADEEGESIGSAKWGQAHFLGGLYRSWNDAGNHSACRRGRLMRKAGDTTAGFLPFATLNRRGRKS
jgi:hypothetical protein